MLLMPPRIQLPQHHPRGRQEPTNGTTSPTSVLGALFALESIGLHCADGGACGRCMGSVGRYYKQKFYHTSAARTISDLAGVPRATAAVFLGEGERSTGRLHCTRRLSRSEPSP